MKIEIKKATKKDKDSLLILRYLLRKYENNVENREGISIKKILEDKGEIEDGLNSSKVSFFIAYYKNIPVGYTKLKIKRILGEVMGHVGGFFILDKFRNKGLGKKLMKSLVNILKKKKIKKISVEVYKKNKIGIKVYKKLGFKISKYDPNSKISYKKIYRLEKNLK